VSAGPAVGFLASGYSSRDRYREEGLRVEVEYTRIPSVWVSFAGELGRRSYQAYESNAAESLFSDYTYYRLNLFLNVRLWKGLSLNGFADHQPEKHKRAGDDNATTLFSLDLSYSF